MRYKLTVFAVCLIVATSCAPFPASGEETRTDASTGDPAKTVEASQTEGSGEAELRFKAARVRLEVTVATGTPSGHRSRAGDFNLRTAVDYEIPVLKHMTVSPRAIPYVNLHESGADGGTLSAFGVGIVLRGYSNGEEQRGWFGEGALNLIGQTSRFSGNTGTFNLMEEFGIGYMFKSRWHVSAKINHISNASLADHNAGANSAGLGFGFTFKPHKAR